MKIHSSLSAVALAVVALGMATAVRAESTYGYNAAGSGTVTATARLNINIVVPKVVVLRVGSMSTTRDSLDYNVKVTIPAGTTNVTGDATTTPTPAADSQSVSWDGTAPTVALASTTAPTAAAYAWSNASTVKVTCSATLVATNSSVGGPTLANIGVAGATGQNFVHPGGASTDLSACNGVNASLLNPNTLYTNTWTYTLDTTNLTAWPADSYTGSVIYTATGT